MAPPCRGCTAPSFSLACVTVHQCSSRPVSTSGWRSTRSYLGLIRHPRSSGHPIKRRHCGSSTTMATCRRAGERHPSPPNSSFDGPLPHQASLDQIDDSSGRSHPTSTSSSPRRCVHVNFIDRTDGTVHGEDEFLFSPYSGYTVRCIRWCDDPMVDAYTRRFHIIEVIVVHVVSAHLHTCGFQCKQVLVHVVHPYAMLSM